MDGDGFAVRILSLIYFLNLLNLLNLLNFIHFQKKAPGNAPRVEPRPEPRAEKKPPPLLREALARALRSSAGMPSVRPSRLESTPKRPESPCNAAIWRWKAVFVKASWFCCAWPASAIPF